jgi:PKD repeat protein
MEAVRLDSLYGTADAGGALSTNGTVFVLSAPFVQFTASPNFGVTPVTVNFTAPAADNYGNTITSWTWNFGDGSAPGAGQNPSHIYTNAGTFSPTIQVVNNNGLLISGAGPSIVTYAPTTIGFTASPINGTAPLTVNFVSPAVDSATNAITSWNWNFGDGTTGTGQNPSHTYNGAGQFSPILNATNINGVPVFPSGQSATIEVFGATVEFTASPTNGAVPLTVNFSSPAVDNEGHAIISWAWDFNDGSTGTGRNPTHIYTSAGTFAPTFTATNSLGASISGFSAASITATNLPMSSGLVLNGGFATGDFTGWTLTRSPANALNIFVDDGTQTGITPFFGNSVAVLGSFGSLSYLSQTLPTTAGAPYLISLWLDSPDGLTPNQFLVSWNGTNLFNQTNIPAIGWTNLQFLVTATGPATTLQLGFRDDPTYLGLDGVTVVQPAISGVNSSGTNLIFNGVNGLSGLTNYLLMGTNILEPLTNWTRVATNVVGTNGNFTNTIIKPVIPGAGQRYYIIQFHQ